MDKIVAVVGEDRDRIGGGAPIFIAGSGKEKEAIAFYLEKIMDASAHMLPNGVMILVKHG